MYGGVREILGKYWEAYGGVRALLKSPYLHLAALLTIITFNFWLSPDWWKTVQSVLPNLLGFTLGGFAIFIGFADENFKEALATPDEENPDAPSFYISLCATFVHFIVVQTLALTYAVVAEALWFKADWLPQFIKEVLPVLNFFGGFVGYCLFLYSLTSVLAATLHVFRIATIYDDNQKVIAELRAELDEKSEVTPLKH